ncbi:MAG: methyltransferase, partial [Betaproteobacteria bacterium]|nr:methyltransferase [Betaproteobacteria bacterium]
MGMLVLELDENYDLGLRRAPDVRQACADVYGPGAGRSVIALRELLGLIGAHEWRLRGMEIPQIAGRIHPYYGV